VLTPAEAAQLQQPAMAVTVAAPTSAAEAAATAALNLGAAAGSTSSKESAGLIMHARRLSGGGSLKLMSNLKAIDEEGDKPVHIIQTDSAVTEVYGHGLTIIRATGSTRKVQAWCGSAMCRCSGCMGRVAVPGLNHRCVPCCYQPTTSAAARWAAASHC
jgi:hypothetical protein